MPLWPQGIEPVVWRVSVWLTISHDFDTFLHILILRAGSLPGTQGSRAQRQPLPAEKAADTHAPCIPGSLFLRTRVWEWGQQQGACPSGPPDCSLGPSSSSPDAFAVGANCEDAASPSPGPLAAITVFLLLVSLDLPTMNRPSVCASMVFQEDSAGPAAASRTVSITSLSRLVGSVRPETQEPLIVLCLLFIFCWWKAGQLPPQNPRKDQLTPE